MECIIDKGFLKSNASAAIKGASCYPLQSLACLRYGRRTLRVFHYYQV
jgi:hypothetical protein